MKVYVDFEDMNVINDLFEATNSYECWACNRDDDLEIVSLSDYAKQVRKEVCDKIRENATSHNNLEVDMYYITPQQLYEIEKGE